jgi:hypothetical protein
MIYALGEEVYILAYDDEDRYRPLKGTVNSLPTSSTTPGRYTIRQNDNFELRVYPSEVYKTIEDAIRDIPDQEKMLRQLRAQQLANGHMSRSRSPSIRRKSRKSHKNRRNSKSRKNRKSSRK